MPSCQVGTGFMALIPPPPPEPLPQLDSVANALATTVNTQLEAGYTTSGAAGSALFAGSGASGLSVSSSIAANPTLLGISSSATDAANNGVFATVMSLP